MTNARPEVRHADGAEVESTQGTTGVAACPQGGTYQAQIPLSFPSLRMVKPRCPRVPSMLGIFLSAAFSEKQDRDGWQKFQSLRAVILEGRECWALVMVLVCRSLP